MSPAAQELERLDTGGVAGLAVRDLGSKPLYRVRLPRSPRWGPLSELVQSLPTGGWHAVLSGFGYKLRGLPGRLPEYGYLANYECRPVLIVHPHASVGGCLPPPGLELNAMVTEERLEALDEPALAPDAD